MYPRINELVRILHGHEISTFLVTNAQFPDAIRWAFFLLNFVSRTVYFYPRYHFPTSVNLWEELGTDVEPAVAHGKGKTKIPVLLCKQGSFVLKPQRDSYRSAHRKRDSVKSSCFFFYPFQKSYSSHSVVRECRRKHKGKSQENRPPAVQRFLAAVSGEFKSIVREGLFSPT